MGLGCLPFCPGPYMSTLPRFRECLAARPSWGASAVAQGFGEGLYARPGCFTQRRLIPKALAFLMLPVFPVL